ncbi:MAG TPA: hypothetical protein VLQ45_31805 [Thermoanaerobaculia bacterium]|nr:hypothetical protein [Thermoanaerobaculia bacterium]
MSSAMLSSVFTGTNQSGTSRLFGVSSSQRYTAVPTSEMVSNSIFRNLSSATVFSSSRADATVLLFRPLVPFLSMGDYNGFFLQLTNRRDAGSELDVNNFTGQSFDNLAENILFVAANKDTEIRLSFRDLFLNQWRTLLDGQLAGSEAQRDGDPTLTWEMFPVGISHLDSSLRYLKIHQPLDIVLDWWPDYNASITYHIFLFIDGAGRLRGNVARWAYWVEGGIKSGGIADELEPKVIAGMDTLNEELANQLDALSFTFTDLYYLPGRQTSRAPTGALTGTTFDDVTIVLQF